MKRLRTTLSLFLFYILGLISGAIVCGALAVYVGLSWLHQPQRSDNENVRQLLLWGQVYADELNQLEDLQKQAKAEAPPLCDIVCNPSNLSSTTVAEDSATYLNQYWQTQKKRALEDPLFFMAMGKVEVLQEAFPRPLRNAILEDRTSSKLGRIYRAFILEWELTVHASRLALNWDDFKKKWDQSESFQEGVLACRAGEKPRQQVIQDCQQSHP